jgi:tripeptidyl-peptidase-1
MVNFLAINGQFQPILGTSASTPVVASMITLINDARITAGKKSVGFLNPMVCFSSFHRWTLKLNDL